MSTKEIIRERIHEYRATRQHYFPEITDTLEQKKFKEEKAKDCNLIENELTKIYKKLFNALP